MHFRFVQILYVRVRCTSVLSFLWEIAIKFISKNFLSLELFYFCTMYRTSIYNLKYLFSTTISTLFNTLL